MVKFDNRLLKYLVMIIIIYFLVSKVPSEQLPGNNPFSLTGIISVVLYILDQPNILFENFDNNVVQQSTKSHTKSTEIVDKNTLFDKNTLKSIVREVFNENKQDMINISKPNTSMPTESQSQPQIKEHFELAPITTITETKKEEKKDTSVTDMLTSGLPTTAKIVSDAINATKADKCDCEETANKAIVKFLQQRRLLDNNGMLHYADAYIGDMGYSQIKLDTPLLIRGSSDLLLFTISAIYIMRNRLKMNNIEPNT